MTKKVTIQGQHGSFHDIAVQQFFKAAQDIELIGKDTFSEAFQALIHTDYVVVAIENSLFGSINKVYDLLLKHKFWICGEVYLHIKQCLIGHSSTKLEDITHVHSQLEALAQCEDFLEATLPTAKRIEEHDTAASVELVAKNGNIHHVAIASEKAAKLFNMKVIKKGIESNKQNYTRFVVLQQDRCSAAGANKTSLVLQTKADTAPGSLHKALSIFSQLELNLSLIQSRPIIGKAWHYLFYVDVDAALDHSSMQQALELLEKEKFTVTILGSYVSGR